MKVLKKKYSFQRKNILAYFFSHYRIWQTSKNNVSGNTRFFEKFCASYMITPLGPKKSRTKFFKLKAIVPKKKILAIFFSCYPLWQTWSNILLCSTRFFSIYGVSYKIISLTPRSLFKTQVFERKGNLSSEEKILAYFARIIECNKPQGQLMRVQKYSDKYWGSYKINSVTP